MSDHAGGEAILLTGATGRVGGLLRAVWSAACPGEPALVPLARHPGDGRTRAVASGAAWPPRAKTIAALWGVVPGRGGDPVQNMALARAAMALGAEVGARLVIHCSSAAVYAPVPGPLSENTPPDPSTVYGLSKLGMEETAAAWQAAHPGGPRAVCLRIGNVAGAESLFAAMERASIVTLDRFADGAGPERSYIAPSDLARVIAALAAADPAELPPVINVAAPRPTAMADIARAAGRDVTWRRAPATAVRRVALDTRRLSAFCRLGPEAAEPAHLVADWRRAGTERA